MKKPFFKSKNLFLALKSEIADKNPFFSHDKTFLPKIETFFKKPHFLKIRVYSLDM